MYRVYEHWRPDKNVCFYVGKGKRWRPFDTKHRNKKYRNIVEFLAKIGLMVDIRIIAENLTNEDAIRIERDRIALYGRDTLANFTDGGEGTPGRVLSPESRLKLSVSNTGKKHSAETRRKLSEISKRQRRGSPSAETRSKISAANRLIFADPAVRKALSERESGKTISAEQRAKISQSLKGHTPYNKGKTISAEQKIKVSEGLRRYYASRNLR